MPHSEIRLSKAILVALLIVFFFTSLATAAPRRLPGHVPYGAINFARHIGRLSSNAAISMALVLPLRNEADLQILLGRLYDPADPLYGKYISTQEFIDQFSPTQADYDAMKGYAVSLGFTVTGTHPNRTLLDIAGPAAAVESAFNLHMHFYQALDGRQFYAPDNNPEVPDFVAARITGIVGLDSLAVRRPHNRLVLAASAPGSSPAQIGTGPGGGLIPTDITKAYNLTSNLAAGANQVLGLFELDGYNASDVAAYVKYYNLNAVPLQNVLVDGFSGKAGSGAGEVTLDIELQNALAPGASKIIVYEGPNTDKGVVDTYNRIATDNSAKQISTSWGLSEGQTSSTVLTSENSAFMQMAAQGQSIYAAAGDSGAYDNGSTLSVDDPASQPYVTGTGGTQLSVNSGETYTSETTWNNGSINSGAGGGGISAIWPIPSWQQNVLSNCSMCSTNYRNVPDVSLNSDQYTGYSIYYKGQWTIYGGTSCASPLWAAFTARVNQQRAANGIAPLGFANLSLYPIATGSNYFRDFHDIADQSINLYYAAVSGYDNATGLGSFNGNNLLSDLASVPTAPPPAPTNLTATAGNASVSLKWNASSGAVSYNIYRASSPGGEGSSPIVKNVVGTTYQDSGLTNGTIYYYTVTAVNGKAESGPSNEASATPAPPVLSITSGPTAAPSKTSATIQWSTNIASSSIVYFSANQNNLNGKVSSGASVTSHSVTLSGLSRKTTYYYQVSSTASGSATATSIPLSFTTQ
jgi:subtilase family serine protease